jgi:hypothetical protein
MLIELIPESGCLELDASESIGCAANRTRIPSLATPRSLLFKLALVAAPRREVKLPHPDVPAPVAREPKARTERAELALPVLSAEGFVARKPARGLAKPFARWAMT